MQRLSFLFLGLLLASSGCADESLALSIPKEERHLLERNGDSNVLRMRAGTSAVVWASITHPEIEGSTTIEVHELVADDSAIVSVVRIPPDRWELRAAGIGETVLRAKNDGDERASVPIKVLP